MESGVLWCATPPLLPVERYFHIEEDKDSDNIWSQESGGERASNSELTGSLKSKILRFRDALNLPPVYASITFQEVLVATLEDLQNLYGKCAGCIDISYVNHRSLFQVLLQFYKVLKLAGDLWVESHREREKVTFEELDAENLRIEQISEAVINRLDLMNAHIPEMFDLMRKNPTSSSEPKDDRFNVHRWSNPVSPNSVLPEPAALNQTLQSLGSSDMTWPPLLRSLRLQAVSKLKPIDAKRFAFHLFPLVLDHNSKTVNQTENVPDDLELPSPHTCMILEPTSDAEFSNSHVDGSRVYEETGFVSALTDSPSSPVSSLASPLSFYEELNSSTLRTHQSVNIDRVAHAINMDLNDKNTSKTSKPTLRPILCLRAENFSPTPAPPPSPMVLTGVSMFLGSPRDSTMKMETIAYNMAFDSTNHVSEASQASLSVSPLSSSKSTAPRIQTSVLQLKEEPTPSVPTSSSMLFSNPTLHESAPCAPPPIPSNGSIALAAPPSPPPLPSIGASSIPQLSLPSPKGSGPPPPPPPLSVINTLCAKNSKLKRSAQMGNLYRVLKGKVEGSNLDGRALNGRKNQVGRSSGGNKAQGMADALAEMTKRSAYFQQIEEDVKKHSASILVMKSSLNSFETKDMKELLKFHQCMEQKLENLTDETQVLSRFEGFPLKKLETVRMAVALHMKLESIVTTLKGWKLASPVAQQLAKVECYFNKIKEQVDLVERSKDEESKRFKSHKIEFDFTVLTRIKEGMVDLSSDCIDMVLKESREIKEIASETISKSKGLSKLLWRAFELSFRIYNFAGGQDDRADRLTKELAHAIETDPQF